MGILDGNTLGSTDGSFVGVDVGNADGNALGTDDGSSLELLLG